MRRSLLLASIAAIVRCATLAESAGGDQNPPSSGVGPFRKLAAEELSGVAPFVLDDSSALYRQPAALPLPDGSVALYVVMHGAQGDVIARTRATDARSFFGATQDFGHKPQQVLASDQSWENANLAHPSAVTVSSGVWLYYASGGSVGLARSTDGLSFTKVGAPVLAQDALGPIASPSVAQFPNGVFHMLFVQGDSIYEATSTDGSAWQRVTMEPVLSPAPPAVNLAVGEVPPFDTLSVADPCLVPRMTPAGRVQVRVLYTGYAQGEAGVGSAIGFAARYGDAGPLVRAAGAVYAVSKHERSPAFYETSAVSFLYVEEQSADGTYRAIAGAVSPPTVVLPAPSAYAPSP